MTSVQITATFDPFEIEEAELLRETERIAEAHGIVVSVDDSGKDSNLIIDFDEGRIELIVDIEDAPHHRRFLSSLCECFSLVSFRVYEGYPQQYAAG